MLENRNAIIDASVAEFFDALTQWKESGYPYPAPQAIDLMSKSVRKGVLPFAVLAARLNDRHQDIADLIDDTLSRIYWPDDLSHALKHAPVVADLEASFDCLCYLGFRRAQFIKTRKFWNAISDNVHRDYGNKLTSVQFRYLMSVLSLCRARLDTEERQHYALLCEYILFTLISEGDEHFNVHNTYQIVRWFTQPTRLHNPDQSTLVAFAHQIGRNYFAKRMQFLPLQKLRSGRLLRTWRSLRHRTTHLVNQRKNVGDNIVKEVAIAMAIGHGKYASSALDHVQNQWKKSKSSAFRKKMESRMVDLAYVAANDELYGDWNPKFRKLLLNNPHNTNNLHIVSVLQRFGRYERAEKQLLRGGRRTLRAKAAEALLLRYTSRFEEAHAAYDQIVDYAKENLFARGFQDKPPSDQFPLLSLFWPIRLRDEIEYILAAKTAIEAGIAQGEPDDSLIVICPMSFAAFTQIPIHVLADLKGRGCSLISMTPGYIKSDAVSEDVDLNVSNAIYPHFYTDRTTMKKNPSSGWEIDFSARVCKFNGINFYHTLHNTLGIISRGYDIDWTSPIYSHYLRRYQTAIEAMFDKHARLLAYCKESGRRAKLLLTEIQHGLAHAMRLIAERENSGEHIEIFHICNGFEAYHDNIERSQSAQFQCIANLTRHPDMSLAYRPVIEFFEDWNATAKPDLKNAPAAQTYAAKIDAQAQPLKYEGELRFPGRPVIVLLGKILPDLPRPNDVGFIHTDVKDWLLDCCRFADENQINLLVKPHPSEHNSQVSLYVNQAFTSFLGELPPEMRPVVLDRSAFPITGLGEMADGVILWGGNSLVELGLLKIPTMVCGYYGSMDCPAGHFVPSTREEFESFMLGKIDRSRLDAVREKTISFLSYVLHPNHTIPSAFNNRPLYNAEVWPPVLHPATDELKRNGARMADYVLGDHFAIVPDK